MSPQPPVTPETVAVVTAQLGRPARGVRAIAHRCSCGLPDVVETGPRLSDGTPFPTRYYLTCPRACAAIGRLEAGGLMAEMTDRLAADEAFRSTYERAHQAYLAGREAVEAVPELAGVSAGGMPSRVKCLHALVAHTLAAGPGVNPVGDETLARLADWGSAGHCVPAEPA